MGLTLGAAIRRLRDTAGLSQRELARRVGVGYTYLSHIEADRREPTIRVLRQIAASLNFPPSVLLSIVLLVDLPEKDQPVYETLLEQLLLIAELASGEDDSTAIGRGADSQTLGLGNV
jgi:transcriptional regulator with XRE-family HTH domain